MSIYFHPDTPELTSSGRFTFLLSWSKLPKLLFAPVYALCGSPASAMANPESFQHGGRDWQEDYLVGKSDMDAAWYYERRRWRSQDETR